MKHTDITFYLYNIPEVTLLVPVSVINSGMRINLL